MLGVDAFKRGILSYVSSGLFARLTTCEVRFEFDCGIRETAIERTTEIIPSSSSSQSDGNKFQDSVNMLVLINQTHGNVVRKHEFSLNGFFGGVYIGGTADRIDFVVKNPDAALIQQREVPARVIEYKTRRSQKVLDRDHTQCEVYGLLLDLNGFDVRGLRYTIVLAEPNCAEISCRKLLIPLYDRDKWTCGEDICHGENSMKFFEFGFDLERGQQTVMDKLRFLRGEREAISSRYSEVCGNCPYRTECPYSLAKK